MREELFDLSDEYEEMLSQGLRFSGESAAYFLEGRLRSLRRWLKEPERIRRVLDFGCGVGHGTKRLSVLFPGADVAGVDTGEKALDAARRLNGGAGIRFLTVDELRGDDTLYDLCYVNGVFHHIAPRDRPDGLSLIHRCLRPGGMLAFFENNPWNLGARIVMAHIPFDRHARMLSPREAARLAQSAGYRALQTRSLFFFPRFLKPLRFLESRLEWTPLGAQYCILARRP